MQCSRAVVTAGVFALACRVNGELVEALATLVPPEQR